MMNELNYNTAKNLLQKHNQQHLLTFWDRLDQNGQKKLLSQIEMLDFDAIDDWLDKFVINEPDVQIRQKFTAAPCYKAVATDDEQKQLPVDLQITFFKYRYQQQNIDKHNDGHAVLC